MVVDAEQADAAALWVAHSHLIDVAAISPLLIINAPERACAKTLLQTVVGRMCHRPLPAANASLSALFRAVELWKPTIFIDEADTFFRDNTELHGLVNAGHARTGFVLRSEVSGDSYEPRMFSVYSAKSIAGIALERHLPDATMSRGIVLNLRRKRPDEAVDRLRHADDEMFERVVAKLARLAKDGSRQIRLTRPRLPDELGDRAQDNWEPLLAIAEYAGAEWLRRATTAALTLSSASEAATSTGNELLADIREVFERKQGRKISTADLIASLTNDDEKPWATYNRGHPSARVSCRSNSRRTGSSQRPSGLGLITRRKVTSHRNSTMRSPDISGSSRPPFHWTRTATIAEGVAGQPSPPDVTADVSDPDGLLLDAEFRAMFGTNNPSPRPKTGVAHPDDASDGVF